MDRLTVKEAQAMESACAQIADFIREDDGVVSFLAAQELIRIVYVIERETAKMPALFFNESLNVVVQTKSCDRRISICVCDDGQWKKGAGLSIDENNKAASFGRESLVLACRWVVGNESNINWLGGEE